MFRGLFQFHDHCAHCGTVYENQPGDFTGALHISATATSAFAMALGVLTVLIFDLPLLLTIALDIPIIIFVGLILHRIIKGLWTALMIYTHAFDHSEADRWR
ncbi:MAG: DUF983 domain-containing protein [Anaerolineales bacterium]